MREEASRRFSENSLILIRRATESMLGDEDMRLERGDSGPGGGGRKGSACRGAPSALAAVCSASRIGIPRARQSFVICFGRQTLRATPRPP
jgi:hypothetical protein